MNERIRKLAIKSGIDIRGHLSGVLTLDEKPSVFDLEKFAELIVEEMYDFIMEESANDNGIPDLGKIKEHFGIEE